MGRYDLILLCLLLQVAWLPTPRGLSLTSRLHSPRSQDEMLLAGDVERPRLFFLFMASDYLPNLQIWQNFLRGAARHQDYEAFVHCTDLAGCLQNHPNLGDTFTAISTVKSHWCSDLVTPMNALLAAALGANDTNIRAGHPQDKFIFVSDTTVPVKSFAYARQKLLIDDGPTSNFCVGHWPDWSWYKGKYVLAKHSQWMVLSRVHALKALAVQKEVSPEHLRRQMTPLRWMHVEWFAPLLWKLRKHVIEITHSPVLDVILSLVVPAVNGCSDEFWHMAAAVGALDRNQASEREISIPSMTNGNLTMVKEASEQFQGVCDTYFVIEKDQSNLTKILTKGPDAEKFGGTGAFLRPHVHAGKFFTLSERSLTALRDSKFLFARKVDNETTYAGAMSLVQAFDAFIFSQPNVTR